METSAPASTSPRDVGGRSATDIPASHLIEVAREEVEEPKAAVPKAGAPTPVQYVEETLRRGGEFRVAPQVFTTRALKKWLLHGKIDRTLWDLALNTIKISQQAALSLPAFSSEQPFPAVERPTSDELLVTSYEQDAGASDFYFSGVPA